METISTTFRNLYPLLAIFGGLAALGIADFSGEREAQHSVRQPASVWMPTEDHSTLSEFDSHHNQTRRFP